MSSLLMFGIIVSSVFVGIILSSFVSFVLITQRSILKWYLKKVLVTTEKAQKEWIKEKYDLE